MALIRINPTKMLVGGDKRAAQNFLGPARSQMEILKNQMSFQNLSQGVRKIWLQEDVYVECRKIFNYQECRIWVRPMETSDISSVYFYVRISCEATGRKMDRIILWRCREEEKGTTIPDVSYIDSGTYEDARKWGVIVLGAVILDVDVENEIVYSESGGVEVKTDLKKEEQLSIARKYIVDIRSGRIPSDLSGDFKQGKIYSPFDLSIRCGSTPSFYGELYFDMPLTSYISRLGMFVDFYHMNTTASLNSITGDVSCPNCRACKYPETEFLNHDWPKFEENRDKYLPSHSTQPGELGCVICGEYIATTWGGETVVSGSMQGSCGFSFLTSEKQHKGGSFFTTDNKYPCFFVTEIGISDEKIADRVDYKNSDCEVGTAHAEMRIANATFNISTPLELLDIEECEAASTPGNPCNETSALYNWSAGAEALVADDGYLSGGAGITAGSFWSGFPGGVLHYPPDPYSFDPNDYYTSVVLHRVDNNSNIFSCSLCMVDEKTKQASLSIFIEKNTSLRGGVGHPHPYYMTPWTYTCNGIKYNYLSSTPLVHGYSIGTVFYLMQPEYYSKKNEITGQTDYWDIHSEREISQYEINHNREMDLEDYINAILVNIKEMPENKNQDKFMSLEGQGYKIQTGFVYQKH